MVEKHRNNDKDSVFYPSFCCRVGFVHLSTFTGTSQMVDSSNNPSQTSKRWFSPGSSCSNVRLPRTPYAASGALKITRRTRECTNAIASLVTYGSRNHGSVRGIKHR